MHGSHGYEDCRYKNMHTKHVGYTFKFQNSSCRDSGIMCKILEKYAQSFEDYAHSFATHA